MQDVRDLTTVWNPVGHIKMKPTFNHESGQGKGKDTRTKKWRAQTPAIEHLLFRSCFGEDVEDTPLDARSYDGTPDDH